jgi:hypothetical protein
MTISDAARGRYARGSVTACRRQNLASAAEFEALISCLEEAGATLLSLPTTGFSTALKTSSLPILREAAEAYGWSTADVRPAKPSANRISRMDLTFGYLALIPQDRYLLRRIVGCRALVHPITGRHLFSWRRLGEVLGADHKAIQRWHAEGIRIIVLKLQHLAADEKAAQSERMRRAAKTPPVAQACRGSLDRVRLPR